MTSPAAVYSTSLTILKHSSLFSFEDPSHVFWNPPKLQLLTNVTNTNTFKVSEAIVPI